MAYLVVVTFDISNANPSTYQAVQLELNGVGLYTTLTSSDKKVLNLPANTFAGFFDGASSGKVRDDLTASVTNAFKKLGVTGRIFIAVGGDWGWAIQAA